MKSPSTPLCPGRLICSRLNARLTRRDPGPAGSDGSSWSNAVGDRFTGGSPIEFLTSLGGACFYVGKGRRSGGNQFASRQRHSWASQGNCARPPVHRQRNEPRTNTLSDLSSGELLATALSDHPPKSDSKNEAG